jgi:hypothetical protein
MPLTEGRASLWRLIAAALLSTALLAEADPAAAQTITGTNRVVATHGAWQVVLAETNRGKVCYAAGSPSKREPEGAVRGRGFVFVTTRPDDRVRDEISILFGFEAARRSGLTVGGETFALAGDSDGAWIADLVEEVRLVAAMRQHAGMTITSVSALGEATVDTYSLTGFAEALAHARRACADGAPTN